MSAEPASHTGLGNCGCAWSRAMSGNPLAQAWDLEERRRRQWLPGLRWRVAGLAGLGVLAGTAAWLARIHQSAPIDSGNLPGLALACAALAALVVGHERTRAGRDLVHGWLASAPLPVERTREALRRRVIGRSIGRLVMVWLAGMGLALAAGAAWLAMIVAPALGVAMGGTAGWWLARRPSQAAPLVLPRLARRSHCGGTEAGLRALSRWPSAMLRADANPRLHALITGSLLMALPDMPLSRALAVLLLLALALLAWDLATATLKTLREAADWLGVSPLGSRRRQWAVLRKSAASVLVVVVAMAALALALGFPGWLVLAVAVTWLSACIRAFALEGGRGAPARRERA
ncbi:MAG: hypothetical protein J0H15_12680 [Xanthomonadales bacterium]|nr:hypothetical protein [Xanthomonadales bacterium]